MRFIRRALGVVMSAIGLLGRRLIGVRVRFHLAGSCNIKLNHSIHGCDSGVDGGGLFGRDCGDNIFEYDNVTEDGVCYQGPVEGGLYLTS